MDTLSVLNGKQVYEPQILPDYLESLYYHSVQSTQPNFYIPRGTVEIFFRRGSFSDNAIGKKRSWPLFFIAGLHSRLYGIYPGKNAQGYYSINFKAGRARHFLSRGAHTIKNQITGKTLTVDEQLIETFQEGEPNELLARLEHFLSSLYKPISYSEIKNVLVAIEHSNGFLGVEELRGKAFLSSAQFRKRFNVEVGTSPQEYCKLKRVGYSVEIMKSGYEGSLTDLTYDLGYYDQSHFIREFKSVTRYSPKAFLELLKAGKVA